MKSVPVLQVAGKPAVGSLRLLFADRCDIHQRRRISVFPGVSGDRTMTHTVRGGRCENVKNGVGIRPVSLRVGAYSFLPRARMPCGRRLLHTERSQAGYGFPVFPVCRDVMVREASGRAFHDAGPWQAMHQYRAMPARCSIKPVTGCGPHNRPHVLDVARGVPPHRPLHATTQPHEISTPCRRTNAPGRSAAWPAGHISRRAALQHISLIN